MLNFCENAVICPNFVLFDMLHLPHRIGLVSWRIEGIEISFLVYEQNHRRYRKLERLLSGICRRAGDDVPVYRVNGLEECVRYLESEYIDAVFVSLDDPDGSGLFLSESLRERDESLAMIAVAKTPVHVAECWKLHFSGYLDDLSEAGVSDELENLRCGSQI